MGHTRLLARVKAKVRRARWLEGLLWGLATAVLAGVLAGAVGLKSVPLARGLLLCVPFLALAVAFFHGVFRVRRELGDDTRVARYLSTRVPAASVDLLSAVELESALAHAPDFSRELAQAFLVDVSNRAETLNLEGLVDARPARYAAGALAAALLTLGALTLLTPTGFWRRLSPTAGRAAQPAETPREPITGEIAVTYHYPAYTGLSARTVEGTNGELSAPEGTRVDLSARADRPVEQAVLLVNGAPVPLAVRGGRDLSGGFLLTKSGSASFAYQDARGQETARGPQRPITVEPDAAPKVTLMLPAQELEVDPDQELVLKYEATDDYGLAGLKLVYRIDGKEEVQLPLPHDEGRRTQGQHRWALKGLELAAGDRIAYFIQAEDNNAVRGAQKGVSRTHLLRIYNASEHRRDALVQVEALWERLLKQLADRMEGPDTKPGQVPEAIAGQSAVDSQGIELAGQLQTAAQKLNRERDRSSALVAALANISRSYGKAVHLTAQGRTLYNRYHLQTPDMGKRVSRLVGQEIAELEKDALYLEALLDRQRLEEMRHIAAELSQKRRELTSLIEQFQRTQDPKLQKQVLQEAQALKRRIQELMQRMGELSKQIQDEHLNLEALRKMSQERDMQGQMDKVEKMLREGKTEDALLALQKLATQMDEMQKSLDQAQSDQGKVNPELVQKFRQFSDALEKMESEQRRVAQATQEIRDRYREKVKERLHAQGSALTPKLKKQADALVEELKGLNPQEMSSRAEEPLERALDELKNLRNALDVKDYDLAAESAERTQHAAEELSRFGEQQARLDQYFENPPSVKAQSRATANRLSQDAAKARDLNQQLQQLFPPPGSMLSEKDQGKLKQLSQKQHELADKGKGLEQKMEQLNQMAPVFGVQGSERMAGVTRRMGEADERLSAKDASRGYGAQKAALDGLEQLKQQMKQSQSGSGSGGLPMPMMAGNSEGEGGDAPTSEKIEIPDQDQFQAPREFRKDLLDAMKQGTPERYKDQVKRYYEELVK